MQVYSLPYLLLCTACCLLLTVPRTRPRCTVYHALPISWGLLLATYYLPLVISRVQLAACLLAWLPDCLTSNLRIPSTTDCLLPTTYCLLLTTYCLLLTTYYLLLSTYHVLLTTYYLLLTTHYLLLTTYSVLGTTYYLLLTTYYVLLTTYCLLLTYYSLTTDLIHHFLLAMCCVLFTSHLSPHAQRRHLRRGSLGTACTSCAEGLCRSLW